MAKVLLLNLAIQRFNNDQLEIAKTYNPPLGQLYLKSALLIGGHEVEIIDNIRHRLTRKGIIEAVEAYAPEAVGISVYTENVEEAFTICKGIKKKFPNIITFLGGPQASLEPLYTIRAPHVDFLIKNEGESALIEFLEALDSKETVIQMKDVIGIVFEAQEGKVVQNTRRDIKDLDLLPLPYRPNREIEHYGDIINVITSRGCPGNCIYCSATALSGAKYRAKSIEATLMEMVYIVAQFGDKLDAIYINDDTFTAIPDRVFDFVRVKEKYKLDFKWRCESRVDVVTEAMVKALAESNCVGVAFGVESGDQAVLNKIQKEISLLHVERVVELMNQYQIYTSLNFMLGHYCDTLETMNATYQFIKRNFEKYRVGIFTTFNTPFPGTWQRTHMEKIKLRLIKQNYSEYTVFTPSIEGEYFGADEQLEVYKKILPIMMDNDFGYR